METSGQSVGRPRTPSHIEILAIVIDVADSSSPASKCGRASKGWAWGTRAVVRKRSQRCWLRWESAPS